MKEKKHITIKVAGQSFGLDISREQEAAALKAESGLNKMWAKWCEDFHDRSQQQVLAMVAFQYARHYYNLADTVSASEQAITEFEKRLDKILLDVK